MNNEDNNEVSNRSLGAGYWIATHRNQLRMVARGGAITVVVLILLIVVYLCIVWIRAIPQTREIETQLGQSVLNFGTQRIPEAVRIERVSTVAHDSDSADVLVNIQNPNEEWGASQVILDISVDGTSIGKETISLIPLERKVIAKTMLATERPAAPAVEVTVENIQWQRIDTPDALITPQWNISNEELYPIRASAEGAPKTGFEFDVQNATAYGFQSVDCVVTITEGGVITAIGKYPLSAIQSLETKHVIIRWPKSVSANAQATIYMNVDVLNEDRIIR